MHHETKIEQAAAAVATWRDRVRTLTENVVTATAALSETKKRRQESLLAAALGDQDVRKQLDHLLEEDRKAERELDDLRASLPIAEAALANAQLAQKAAEVEWRRTEVERLARERVAAAAAIDQAFADFSAAWAKYEGLGKQLFNAAADDHASNIHSFVESVDGMLRLAASLPHEPFYSLRWRHSFAQIGGGAPLAVAEAAFWRLPPIEAVKAA
jgi:hypothetical protein